MKLKIFGVAWYWYLTILLGVLIILLVLFRALKRGNNTKNQQDGKAYLKDIKKLNRIIQRVDPELDRDTRLMILAQSLFETGGLGYDQESNVLVRNNNLFGMREAHIRDRNQLGDIDQDGYANYKDWEQSVRDHRLWLEHHNLYKRYLVLETYIEGLKKKQYFEANLFQYKRGVAFYYEGLKKIENEL